MPDNYLPDVTVTNPYSRNLKKKVFPGFGDGNQVGTEQNAPQLNTLAKSARFGVDKSAPRKNVFSKFGDVVPYLSNVANSFRNTPLPDAPGTINPVQARQVNYGAQRAEADRQVVGANKNASATLDENTAAAVQGSNLAGGIRAKNSVNEAEANTNAQLGQQANGQNAQIDAQNVQLQNQWKNNLVEGQMAGQMNQSANLSNAADKFIGQTNENNKAKLDQQKWEAYQPLWQNSGVSGRAYGDDSQYATWLKTNNPDAYDQQYPQKKAMGGNIRKKVFTSKAAM